MELNERLAQLRKEHGLSQNDLADQLKVSRQAVSRWEQGLAMPSSDNLIYLSKLYGITLDELIYPRDESKEQKTTQDMKEEHIENQKKKNGLLPLFIAVLLGLIIGIAVSSSEKAEIFPIEELEIDKIDISTTGSIFGAWSIMRERKKVVMKRQKLVSTLLSAFLLANCLAFRTSASEIESLSISDLQHERIEEITSNILGVTPRASVRFEADIEENSISAMKNVKFPLEANETVTINASYSPSSSSMDFGLVTSDGYFYYINVDNGNINKTIRVEERGNYMLAVRNNSDDTVSVVGYVNY